jgi:hypothetical protein
MRRLTSWAGTLAVAIVAMAIGAAIGGAAAGARVAADAAPAIELPAPEALPTPETLAEPPRRVQRPTQAHSVLGRVVASRDNFIGVRTPEGPIVRVRVLPQTVIRRAGERVELDAVERGDRVLAVGRVNENGVLVARGMLAEPLPLRPAGQAPGTSSGEPGAEPPPRPAPPRAPGAEPAPRSLPPRPPGAEPLSKPLPPAIRTALALPPAPAAGDATADPPQTRQLPPRVQTRLALPLPTATPPPP